jgi:hypothetical protein
MKKVQKGFPLKTIIIVFVSIGILSIVGWLYFINNQPQEKKETHTSTPKKAPIKKEIERATCEGADASATNGIFCAEDVGLRLAVPDVFKGKIQKINNYTVTTQNKATDQAVTFGTSEVAYEATLKGKDDSYTLTIAKEPLRNFRPQTYAPSLFNKDTKQMYYFSLEGERDKEVESTTLGGVKFYNHGTGDVGFVSNIYTGVVDDKILVVSLVTKQPGDPATHNYLLDPADYNTMLNQYNSAIKALKVV